MKIVVQLTNYLKSSDLLYLELDSHHHDVTEQITEFERLLQTLEETNGSIKSNNEFKDLQINLKSLREMMLQANESNTELHRHMSTTIEHLKILNLPIEQIEKSLPIIPELDSIKNKIQFIFNYPILNLDEINKSKFSRLGLLNEKIETMKKQRETLLNDFRKKIQDDDITKLALMRRQENHKVITKLIILSNSFFVKHEIKGVLKCQG